MSNSNNRRMIEQLNRVNVLSKDIFKIVEMGEEIHDDPNAKGGGIFLIAREFKDDIHRAQAVYFRMLAVSRLLDSEEIKGWTLPMQQNGAIPVKEDFLKIAASFPLSLVGDDIGFDKTKFLLEVLENAETEGEG